IASDFRKPSGLTVVPPEQVPSFMINLPIRKIHGIGPVAEARLKTIGITHCRDVLNFSGPLLDSNPLISAMGRSGPWLVAAAQGIDHRAVETTWERKSYGREETFAKDVTDLPVLEAELSTLSSRIARDLVRANLKAKTVTLKIKYHNFESITRSRTMMEPLNNPEGIFETLRLLLLTKTEAGVRPVRLIGLSTSRFICA
ncbi:MAG: DNA polymerase IV, partial [Proteobacteria bacterium]|nr:DNA polymerase IV [Pseudomonadota bacterium]